MVFLCRTSQEQGQREEASGTGGSGDSEDESDVRNPVLRAGEITAQEADDGHLRTRLLKFIT